MENILLDQYSQPLLRGKYSIFTCIQSQTNLTKILTKRGISLRKIDFCISNFRTLSRQKLCLCFSCFLFVFDRTVVTLSCFSSSSTPPHQSWPVSSKVCCYSFSSEAPNRIYISRGFHQEFIVNVLMGYNELGECLASILY